MHLKRSLPRTIALEATGGLLTQGPKPGPLEEVVEYQMNVHTIY
jgi:hypothetical protein